MTENQPSATARTLLQQVATTRESRQLLAALLPDLLQVWAQSGTGAGMARHAARKGIAGLAGNSVRNAFLDRQGLEEAAPLKDLAADPDFIQAVAAETGAFLDQAAAILTAALTAIEKLETTQKKELLRALLGELLSGRGAPAITALCRSINEIHQEDPAFLARTLEPGFRNWVSGLDFGEIKEMLDSSAEGTSALVTMINAVLWQYPAKVVSVLALAPPVLNIGLDALGRTLKTFNDKGSPDMVADILLSLLRDTRPDTLATLINELAELVHRFHTGSALIGEPGAPQLPNDLFVLFSEVLDRVDGTTLWKARTALAEMRQSAVVAMTDALADHPELWATGLKNASTVRNARFRSLNHRLAALDDLDPEMINTALEAALSGLDTQEAAETLNNAAIMANRCLETAPETVAEKTAAFAEATDPYELSDLLEQIGRHAGQALKPLARAVVPHLLRGALTALEPDDDEFSQAAAEAREMLLSFIHAQEARSHD
ncbi:MAG: hypothetical protein ACLFPD_01460 [Desulfosudaceae bacterium]